VLRPARVKVGAIRQSRQVGAAEGVDAWVKPAHEGGSRTGRALQQHSRCVTSGTVLRVSKPNAHGKMAAGVRMAERAMIESYEGSCHCGRVRFRIRADLADLLECNCSVCTKKGILHLIVPPEDFELLQGGEDLATYQFNTNTARHTFCRHCGMHPFYVPRSDPDKISVNARCLDGIDPVLRPTKFFDGRNWEAAQAARRAAEGQ
jgi:hypothetical protein